MNYYDELGVSRDASERELRQAYKILVRLLHPDSQTGDDLRMAAERQLTRLNQMLAVLLHAETRRSYDLSLEEGWGQRMAGAVNRPMTGQRGWQADRSGVASEISLVARFALKYWSMILIGAVIFGALALSTLLHGTGESGSDLQAGEAQQPALQPAATKIVVPRQVPQPPLTDPTVEHLAAPAPVSGTRRHEVRDTNLNSGEVALPDAGIPAQLSGTMQARDNIEPPPNANETVSQRNAPAHLAAASSQTSAFSGNWFYTTELGALRASDGYQAIYVELLLSEQDGTLSGSYRARYVVPDKAISPQVSFRLQGRASSSREARLGWSSSNGMRGEAELSLSATGVMEFRWWSTELAGQSGLSSGTAILVRQRTP